MTKLDAGPDVSLETTSVCVVDTDGRVRLEGQGRHGPQKDPKALVRMLTGLDTGLDEPYERLGLEAGPLTRR